LNIDWPPAFHVNNMLKNPRQKPMNILPESPRYIFAGGKFKIKNPRILNSKIIEISVNLF
jgi:hypothetical protein